MMNIVAPKRGKLLVHRHSPSEIVKGIELNKIHQIDHKTKIGWGQQANFKVP